VYDTSVNVTATATVTTAAGGLGGEGNRWTAAVASLTDELNKLAGDVLVVSHLSKLSLETEPVLTAICNYYATQLLLVTAV
jgi:hypothetical protein